MVEAVMLWNEPNNLSHWDFEIDSDWALFSAMVRSASQAIRAEAPDLPIVLGGMSPIDPGFLRCLERQGVLDAVDAVAVHGFPLDWNHWQIDEWPAKLASIRAITGKPLWVTEVHEDGHVLAAIRLLPYGNANAVSPGIVHAFSSFGNLVKKLYAATGVQGRLKVSCKAKFAS